MDTEDKRIRAMPLKALLVDDEPFVRADLCYLLSPYRQIEVVWETGTFKEAEKILRENTIDIVFLDIRLRGGSGFDLIPGINPDVTDLIIITAHEKYKKKALETIALDCLLKPVSPQRLKRVINRII